MLAPVTKIDAWKAAHSRPVVIDYCRWSEAVETVTRANVDMWVTTLLIWPRIMLRTVTGV